MKDQRERLSRTTVILHWLIGLTIIGMLAFGLWIEDMERGPEKGAMIGIHKSIGVLVLVAATLRLFWRLGNGFPVALSVMKLWERFAAHAVHWTLLLATLAMPLSGILMSWAGGHDVAVFGFTVLEGGEKNETLGTIGHTIHSIGSKVFIAIIVIHIAAALKHHFINKDGTLRRMLGRTVDT